MLNSKQMLIESDTREGKVCKSLIKMCLHAIFPYYMHRLFSNYTDISLYTVKLYRLFKSVSTFLMFQMIKNYIIVDKAINMIHKLLKYTDVILQV